MTANVDPAPITCIEDVARLLQPVVVGGDILAYSYVRELHRAYGITRSIVLATQDVKMLSTSKFTDYRLVDGLYDNAETLYFNLEKIAVETYERDADAILLVLGCDVDALDSDLHCLGVGGEDLALLALVLADRKSGRVGKECRSRWSPYH